MLETYPSIQAFYTRYAEARHSAESDYGVWWRDADGGVWRVTYVHDTGHVYAVRGSHWSGAVTLGDHEVLVVSAGNGEGLVVILGRLPTFTLEREGQLQRELRDAWAESGYARELAPRSQYSGPPEMEYAFEGWAEVCGTQGSLEWAYQRVRSSSVEAGS
jgi:hypothetical protein